VGDDVAALASGRRLPVALPDAGAGRPMADAHRAVVLLRAQETIRKVGVDGDSIELRGRLIALRGPARAAVGGDVHAAVVGLDHPPRIVRSDPEIVIVAMRRGNRAPGLAAVFRFVETNVADVDRV